MVMMRVSRRFVAAALCGACLAISASCSHAKGDVTAFCRYSAALTLQQVDLDRVATTDVTAAKRKLISYNRTIQTLVRVAPAPVAADVKPLADQWADYNADVQRARTIDDVHRADQAMTERTARRQQSSDTVRRFVEGHCTADGLNR